MSARAINIKMIRVLKENKTISSGAFARIINNK